MTLLINHVFSYSRRCNVYEHGGLVVLKVDFYCRQLFPGRSHVALISIHIKLLHGNVILLL